MNKRRFIPVIPEDQAAQAGPATVKPGAGDIAGTALTSLPPLALYVHVPWCVRKCPYCDFNSHELKEDLPEQAYLQALQADLEQALPDIWGRSVISVFIGGGTPSLLSADAIDRMLSLFRSHLNLLPDAEITIEANPGTVEAGRFEDYAHSGINRISLGVQSFNNEALHALGRIHSAEQACRAIELAQRAVDRINLDVMFALPNQTFAQCEEDIRQAVSWDTSHLSLYNLTLEPNTVFAKYPPAIPDEDAAAVMQETVAQHLQDAGYERYEVSAYAKSGARCVHNVNYWEFGDYLGLGPGAHSKLSFHHGIVRQARLKNPVSWMQNAVRRDGSHLAQSGPVDIADLPFEFMLNALRLRNGVPAQYFEERTGLPLIQVSTTLQALTEQGLFKPDPSRLCASEQGWQYLNEVLARFLP
ncbi:MAG TPA: oxygen-independent coproporphyrinogen III oxidase-like protein [Pusillimonas sp.]|jgi:oxygen-independent coproporphyrinogen-3 oxidase|nr:YggW family oxidoreductase [Pusillimonas sp.]MBC43534.1 YggW family oxidoreductase [Pusillimonas sp.]HBT33604.1 oxygen-independent coproporphyrinogen III oxidase-like protein [Pusillimonas sp.]HCN72383.1 oxygen-independent coproporphyrinogen III oxidase-like protein [Pusillimonas sp.]|tara:strand:+ start:23616 stop:24863 length:1248 start_codon:yes stop_codon:yes gene_type:complete